MIDVDLVITAFKAAFRFLNDNFGTTIPETSATYVAIGVMTPLIAYAAYAGSRRALVTYRRLRGEKNVLDADGQAVVANIKSDLERLQGEIRKASKDTANRKLLPLLQILNDRIDRAEDLVADSGEAETPEQKLDRNGRMPRSQMVRLVRETVLSNLWAGNYFDETRRRRHVYRATFEDAERQWVSITVRTPYALPPQDDDELPYAIDVRQGTRYVMRIQWDPFKHDDIKIQYVIRGSWEDAILSWNVSQQYIPKVPDTDTDDEQKVEQLA